MVLDTMEMCGCDGVFILMDLVRTCGGQVSGVLDLVSDKELLLRSVVEESFLLLVRLARGMLRYGSDLTLIRSGKMLLWMLSTLLLLMMLSLVNTVSTLRVLRISLRLLSVRTLRTHL